MPQVKNWFGQDKSRDACDVLALCSIPQKFRDNEADLRGSRWFDYRQMNPVEATYLFAGEYRQATKTWHAKVRDLPSAERARGFVPDDLFASKELIAMWLARQAADKIGCKYDFFLNYAFKNFTERGWRWLPRPNQLYAEELVLDIETGWRVECAASLQLASDPFYHADAYAGLPEQDAYHEYVVAQIKQREHHYLTLSSVVYARKALPEAVALVHFPEAVVKRAKQIAAGL
jgi:hypothetical protein